MKMSFEIFESNAFVRTFLSEFQTFPNAVPVDLFRNWFPRNRNRCPSQMGITAAPNGMTKLSRKQRWECPKWSSIFVRFNLNGADHTFHLFGWENFPDSTGLLSPSEKSAATIQCASFPHLKWVHIMPASASKSGGK